MKRFVLAFVAAAVAAFLSTAARAQDVVGGVVTSIGAFGQTGAYTIINEDTPFNAAGQITNATVQIALFGGASACTASDTFRLRVFRPNVQYGYSLVAERGPFTETQGTMNVTITPPITVQRDDRLAIALTGGGTCGPTGTYGSAYHIVQVNGNYTGGTPGPYVDGPGIGYNFRASSSTSALAGTLPGVGVIGGAAGSSFNTTLSMANPSGDSVNVLLAYRAAGAASDATPTTSTVTLAPHGSKYSKLAELFPALSGIGSLDVYTSGPSPVVNARVYNDAGAGGTNGFTEALVKPNEVAHDRDQLWLTIPGDLTAFRMNVGVRTFGSGATLTCVVYSASGTAMTSVAKTYGANSTSLDALQAFFGGDNRSLSPGGSVACFGSTAVSSDLVLYGTVTDNHTNDSALFLAERR